MVHKVCLVHKEYLAILEHKENQVRSQYYDKLYIASQIITKSVIKGPPGTHSMQVHGRKKLDGFFVDKGSAGFHGPHQPYSLPSVKGIGLMF